MVPPEKPDLTSVTNVTQEQQQQQEPTSDPTVDDTSKPGKGFFQMCLLIRISSLARKLLLNFLNPLHSSVTDLLYSTRNNSHCSTLSLQNLRFHLSS